MSLTQPSEIDALVVGRRNAETRVRMAGASEAGQVRTLNQDAFYIGPIGDYRMLAVVADGMGGHRAGEVASRQAVKVIRDRLEHTHRHLPTAIVEALQDANDNIYNYAQSSAEYRGMGTTLTLVLVDDSVALIGHVGDSRAYRVRQGEIRQLTHDHTWVADQLRSGNLSPDEAKTHRWRNVITNALGAAASFKLELSHVELQAGDRLLLCSDGVSSLISAATMQQLVSDHDPPGAVARPRLARTSRAAPDRHRRRPRGRTGRPAPPRVPPTAAEQRPRHEAAVAPARRKWRHHQSAGVLSRSPLVRAVTAPHLEPLPLLDFGGPLPNARADTAPALLADTRFAYAPTGTGMVTSDSTLFRHVF
ncbi:MAG: PP2C family serine/threonine-protein phosphatase [Trueperaceae bacterium]|nr:PP2C family serine/threonine-protein phosphatase [Trueperaceae bacterium]